MDTRSHNPDSGDKPKKRYERTAATDRRPAPRAAAPGRRTGEGSSADSKPRTFRGPARKPDRDFTSDQSARPPRRSYTSAGGRPIERSSEGFTRRPYAGTGSGSDKPRPESRPYAGAGPGSGSDRPHPERRPYAGAGPGSDRPRPERRPYAGAGPGSDRPHGERRPYASSGPSSDRPRSERRPYASSGPSSDRPRPERRPYAGAGPSSDRPRPERRPYAGPGPGSDRPRPEQQLFVVGPEVVEKPVLPAATIEIEPGAGLPDRLEGRNPILEAIKAGRAINKLWVAKREGNPDAGMARLVAMARDAGAVIMEVDRKVLDAMSTTHGHQGVIAQVAAHEYVELDALLQSIRDRSEVPFLLILAEIQESYNLGSILRIADAAGVQGVIIPMRRSVGLDAAVAKASAGAIEHVPVVRVGNLTQTIIELKNEKFWIAGTDADAKTDYRASDWQGPLAILIGSEGEGLSPSLKRQCDYLVSIPMQGKVNSLNAAVAAGIVAFEVAARRRSSKPDESANRPARPDAALLEEPQDWPQPT